MALAKCSRRDAIEEVIAQRRLRFRFMHHDSWENALFVHWPIEPEALATLLPRGLEPDILDGSAWVGLVLLTERGVSAYASVLRHIMSPIDHFGANVRTYVKRRGVPGIYFFSLECTSVLASLGARLCGIPYCPARMWRRVDIEQPLGVGGGKVGCFHQGSPPCAVGDDQNPQDGDGDAFAFEFSSVRVGRHGKPISVTARWKIGQEDPAELEKFAARGEWFTERYSVYTAWPAAGWCRPLLLRGDVQHPPWKLQPAALMALDAQPLLAAAGFGNLASSSTGKPHVCFSRGVGPIDFWMLEPV